MQNGSRGEYVTLFDKYNVVLKIGDREKRMVAASGILKPHTVRLGGGYSWAPITFESHYWSWAVTQTMSRIKRKWLDIRIYSLKIEAASKARQVYPL